MVAGRYRSTKKRPKGGREAQAFGRLRWVAVAFIGIWALVAGRLLQVQGVRQADYAAKAREQHEREVAVEARRGMVLDRGGLELAMDVQTVSFCADPTLVEDPEAVARFFAPWSDLDPASLADNLRSGRRFAYLARFLTGDDLVRARARRFAGVYERDEIKRLYPQGTVAGQVLGFTDLEGERGREGVERAFDEHLRAEAGSSLLYMDARGRKIHGMEQERRLPRDGGSLVLTIDIAYQQILEEELIAAVQSVDAEGALGVIADPNTGEILAMASVPLYDPNAPGRHPARNRRNRAITDAFEPGSTFKAFTAAALLNEGLVSEGDSVFCENGRFRLRNGDVVHDVSSKGWLTFGEVLQNSSNIGTMKAARRLKPAQFHTYMRRFGFGIRAGSGLPAETGGALQHPRDWSERSLETIAIGQEISVTALQMVQAFGAIANGGTLLAPRIVKRIVAPDGETVEEKGVLPLRRVVTPETATRMRDLLVNVVEGGTATRAQVEGVTVAGKTGTAQRASASGRGYVPGEYVVSFIGFLPAEAPEFLCMVVVDNPKRDKWGGQIAAPAFKRIAERVLSARGAAGEQTPIAVLGGEADTLSEGALPDFRGLSPRQARFQAQLRGLQLVLSGEGGLIVGQEPAAGQSAARVVCRLGDGESADWAGALPRRQALLLEKLADHKLAAAH